MSQSHRVVEPTLDDYDRQMALTRNGLREKLTDLQRVISDRVSSASAALTGTTRKVKALTEAVKDVTEASPRVLKAAVEGGLVSAGNVLDVREHVRRFPLMAVGAAVALGLLCGYRCRV